MLVSGLTNKALSTMIANSHGNYSGVHQALYECAQEMVDKYRQKQETPENRSKLEVKTRAATVLFQELGKVPKGADADVIHEALSSALERHAQELQGYEHLVSEKSSNYALVKQTQGLRQQAGASASLLRYHHLKNKLLWSYPSLSPDQKECVSALNERKCLRLEMLENLEKNPDFLTPDIIMFCCEASKLPASKVLEMELSRGVVAVSEQSEIKEIKIVAEQLTKTGMELIGTAMQQIKTYIDQQTIIMEQLETKTVVEQLKMKTVLEHLEAAINMGQLKTKVEVELLKMGTVREQLKIVGEVGKKIKAHEHGLLKSEARDEVVKHEKSASDTVQVKRYGVPEHKCPHPGFHPSPLPEGEGVNTRSLSPGEDSDEG